MDLQAHFSDIRALIAGELDAAAESVVAAVAWLTDSVLLEALVKAARRGCRAQQCAELRQKIAESGHGG